MQIKKINNNRLEVLIDIEDLRKNNISWNTFMSTFIEKQNIYAYILNNACRRLGFGINNCKIKVDSFAIISKRIFVLVITKIPKRIYKNKKYKNNTFFIAKFNSFKNLSAFCNSISLNTNLNTGFNTNSDINSSLYYYKNNYYLKIKIIHMHDYKKIFFTLKEFSEYIFSKYMVNEDADLIIKKNAIEFCKNYI